MTLLFALSILPVVILLLICALLLKKLLGKSKDEPQTLVLLQQIDALRNQVSESLTRNSAASQQELTALRLEFVQQLSVFQQNFQATSGQMDHKLSDASVAVQNVSRQLGELSQVTSRMIDVTKNITSLEEILKPPKLRGGIGEIFLHNILREILPSDEFYQMQYRFKNGDIVDAIVKFDQGLIPIDAKFPLDNFKRMLELTDEKDKLAARKEFLRNVRKHIDDISAKYILPDENTMPFALMYIPAENVYYETILRTEDQESIDLFSHAIQKKVFPVSPHSMYSYLMTISLGLRGLKIEQQAQTLLGEFSRLSVDLGKLSRDFKLVGNHLSDAQKKYVDAEKRLDRLDVKLSALQEGRSEELNLET